MHGVKPGPLLRRDLASLRVMGGTLDQLYYIDGAQSHVWGSGGIYKRVFNMFVSCCLNGCFTGHGCVLWPRFIVAQRRCAQRTGSRSTSMAAIPALIDMIRGQRQITKYKISTVLDIVMLPQTLFTQMHLWRCETLIISSVFPDVCWTATMAILVPVYIISSLYCMSQVQGAVESKVFF